MGSRFTLINVGGGSATHFTYLYLVGAPREVKKSIQVQASREVCANKHGHVSNDKQKAQLSRPIMAS